MSHLSDGTLQAHLDGELQPPRRARAAEHLLGCSHCRERVESLARSRQALTSALALVDVAAPSRAPRADARAQRGTPRPPGWSGTPGSPGSPGRTAGASARLALGRAAVLVMLVAAAASAAIPGSPVRTWVAGMAAGDGGQTGDIAPSPAVEQPIITEPGPRTGAVTGVVTGSDERPVSYARVQLEGGPGGWTDDGGRYRLEAAPPGQQRVLVAHPNHDTLSVDVRVTAGREFALNLTLTPRPGPTVEPLGDFQPFQVEYTLPALLNAQEITDLIRARWPEGEVAGHREAVLRLWLDEAGQVVRALVERSSGSPALDQVAVAVAPRMRFRPARRGDANQRVIVHIPVVFQPPEDSD